MADFKGRPLADYAAQTASTVGFSQMIAVVPKANDQRAQVFANHGFEIVENSDPSLGQAHSIQLGARRMSGTPKALCVMLGDMPFVTASHMHALIKRAPNNGVIKTQYSGHAQPPAVFTGQSIMAWKTEAPLGRPPNVMGDVEILPLSTPLGEDVDTVDDLHRLSDLTL